MQLQLELWRSKHLQRIVFAHGRHKGRQFAQSHNHRRSERDQATVDGVKVLGLVRRKVDIQRELPSTSDSYSETSKNSTYFTLATIEYSNNINNTTSNS